MFTKWKLHVEHEVEQHSERPHVDLVAVHLVREYLWRHIVFSPQNGATHIFALLGEPEVGQLIDLNKEACTNLSG